MPAAGNKSKKNRLQEYLSENNLTAVTERDWHAIVERLAPVSESYLRHLLAETGIPVEQPFAGVRQKSFAELEQSLIEMEEAYMRAQASGDRVRAQVCRNVMIQAKDHARMAARSPKASPEKRLEKEEMIQWMLVWLENPGVFAAWVRLRKKNI